jgi:hypothetical protein
MSGDYFSVLAILIPHRFDFALHASPLMFYPYSMFLLFYPYSKEFYFFLFLAYQILHVFLPDISVHCALIDYAFI